MNILLTSLGRRTYMINFFKSALAGKGDIYASNSIDTYSLHCADKFVITPQIYDETYIDFLLDYCVKNKITAVISLFDIDLYILSINKEKFLAKNIQVLVSDPKVIDICNDKWKTYNFLKEIGLKQAQSYINFDFALEDLLNKRIDFPLILKPRWGMGSIGIYRVDSLDEMQILYKKLKREIFETYLKFESQNDLENAIIIQEVILGKEHGIEILNDLYGNFVTVIAKEKLAMRAGETDIAKIVGNKFFLNLAKTISEKLKHIANLDVDCFITRKQEIIVLEMNCRFGGQYPFSHLAGVDFPQQIIDWLEGKETDLKLITPKINTLSCKDLVPVMINQ